MKLYNLVFVAVLTAQGLAAAPFKEEPLVPDELRQLERDKILLRHRRYRQVFTPYIFSPMPVFITSDSLLSAFHVVLEETVAQMEERFSSQLAPALDEALERIRDAPPGMTPECFAAAAKHARIVLGTADRLAGGKWKGDAEVEAAIAVEVQGVLSAEAVLRPPWLAPTIDLAGIDYRVFKPSGFYTRNERMKSYLRAVRWMQSIPFRATVAVEMEAMKVLAPALERTRTIEIAEAHRSLTGEATDPDVRAICDDYKANSFPGAAWLENRKQSHMVLVSAADVPDAGLFRQTTNPRRPFPDPLDVAALLQSSLAADLVQTAAIANANEMLLKVRERLQTDDSLYGNYLRCLSLLADAPDAGAPAFMNSVPWHRKSLNTIQAGWAQMRHTWTLQAKDNAHWLPFGDPYPGFVEPDPDFFAQLSRLIIRCAGRFDRMGTFEPPVEVLERDAAELLPLLEKEMQAIKERIKPFEAIARGGRELTEAEMEEYTNVCRFPEVLLKRLAPFEGAISEVAVNSDGTISVSFFGPDEFLQQLRDVAAGKRRDVIRSAAGDRRPMLRDRWMNLLDICHRLESLAHKQLRGVDPTEEEASFIVEYGSLLGGVMFYDGNSYHDPRDDAPRAAVVFNQPGGQCLIAAVGRPREIRVLYPWKGKEIHCRGAILPFHSFLSDTRLTDREWVEKLDSPGKPALESWLQPILTPVKPEMKEPE